MVEVKVMTLTGMLGHGFPEATLKEGLRRKPDVIGVDAGSMDGGAYPLGEGRGGISLDAVYRDLSLILPAALSNDIPLIIGSAGLAGGEPHIEIVMNMLHDLQKKKGLRKFTVAVIHSEIEREYIKQKIREGRVKPMPGFVPQISEQDVDKCQRIVGQMGVTPFIEALKKKTDVIVAGRSCDTAIFAAMPIMKGCSFGPAFHAAKIMECGAYAAEPGKPSDGLFAIIRDNDFILDTLNPALRCTPLSITAHTLYENAHPSIFTEPDGTVDCSEAIYEQISPTAVRVRNSKYIHAEPGKATIKLEGATKVGYRAISIAGARDPKFIENYEYIEAETRKSVENIIGPGDEVGYSIQFRVYGRNAVLQSLETHASAEHEIGIVIDVVAKTQELATSICGHARGSMMHKTYPGRKTIGGNLAFSFSPLDIPVGPVYEFGIYHTMEVDDLNELFPIEVVEVG